MTEHSKIPLPKDGKPEKSGSLFERASGSFGLGAFNAAPVPKQLPDSPVGRGRVDKIAERVAARKAKADEDAAREAKVAADEASKAKETRQEDDVDAVDTAPVAGPPIPQPYFPEPAPVAAPEVGRPNIEEHVESAVPQGMPTADTGTREVASQSVPQPASEARFQGEIYEIDREHMREQGLIVPEAGVSELLEEFRIVKRQVLSAARYSGDAASRRILICSPHPGEGKTFCSANLAIAMAAERDMEVLLIDADFAKPSILSTFGLPRAPGFMDVLADSELSPENLVMGTDIPGLWILPAGNKTQADSEFLGSRRTAEVLDALTINAPNRVIIFDTPPALAASPAAELAKHVGQAILVARADMSGQSALEDSVRLLSACPDIKLLLNAAHFSPSGRQFGDYGYER